jgi:hypothetical protein
MAIQERMGDRAYWGRNNPLRKFPNFLIVRRCFCQSNSYS